MYVRLKCKPARALYKCYQYASLELLLPDKGLTLFAVSKQNDRLCWSLYSILLIEVLAISWELGRVVEIIMAIHSFTIFVLNPNVGELKHLEYKCKYLSCCHVIGLCNKIEALCLALWMNDILKALFFFLLWAIWWVIKTLKIKIKSKFYLMG